MTKRKLTECPPGAAGDATGTRRSPCFKPPAKLHSEQVRSLPKRTLRSSAGQGTGSEPHGDCGPQLALQTLAYMEGAASPGVAPGSSPPLLAVSARTSWVTAALSESLPSAQSKGEKELNVHRNGTPLQYSCLENPMDRGAW